MNLKPALDDLETMVIHRMISENGIVEIGVYKVIFGWRVRAGFCGDAFCQIDWCGGDNWENVERLFSICHSILTKRDEDKNCFNGIPETSRIKPFYNDLNFLIDVLEKAGDFEIIKLKRS